MNNRKKKKSFDDFVPDTQQITDFLLGLLTVVILLALFGGIIKTLIELRLILETNLDDALRQALINITALLAVIEVLKTVRSYLVEGHVKVRYIIDTVIIVMLKEVMSYWFKGKGTLATIGLLLGIIGTLTVIRIFAVKFNVFDDNGKKQINSLKDS